MTVQKRLQVLEDLYIKRIDEHVAQVTPLFIERFSGQELRAIAATLRALDGQPHDAAAAAAGVIALRDWRTKLSMEVWRSLWLLDSILDSVNEVTA